ncbi:MAG: hypothetical protein ACP5HH_06870 [Fervidicoccaceae archaeon]
MSDEEKELSSLSCEEGRVSLEKFLREMNVKLPRCSDFFCRRSGRKLWVYCIEDELKEIVAHLIVERERIYHAGFLAGYIEEGGRFVPSLELGWELATRGAVPGELIVMLNEAEEKEFIFGRSVPVPGLPRNRKDLLLVLNKRGEFLGWGKVLRGSIFPVADIGSYIRSKD